MGRKQIEKTGVAAKKHWKVSEKIILIVAILLLLLGAIAIFGRTMVSMRLLGDETLDGGQLSTEIQTPSDFRRMLNLLVVGVSDDPDERESTGSPTPLWLVSVNIEDQEGEHPSDSSGHLCGRGNFHHKINAIYAQNPDHWDYAGLDGLSRMIYESVPGDH